MKRRNRRFAIGHQFGMDRDQVPPAGEFQELLARGFDGCSIHVKTVLNRPTNDRAFVSELLIIDFPGIKDRFFNDFTRRPVPVERLEKTAFEACMAGPAGLFNFKKKRIGIAIDE